MLRFFSILCMFFSFQANASVCLRALLPSPIATPQRIGKYGDKEFIALIMQATDDFWTQTFRDEYDNDIDYTPIRAVIFQGETTSGCGTITTREGLLYCKADQTIYVPHAWLERRKAAQIRGEADWAYAIAHEVGHHVQRQLPIQVSPPQPAQHMRIRNELQADCLAGFWVGHSSRLFESRELVRIQAVVQTLGDDAGTSGSFKTKVRKTFVHGTNVQRLRWFNVGLSAKNLAECNTFTQNFDEL